MREFSDFGMFAEFLVGMAVLDHEAMKGGLEKSTALIEKDAKDQLGVYQPAVGHFDAWPELADSTKADRLAQGFPENEPLERTGALRDSISSRVEGLEAQVGSNSDIAVYQELGTEDRDGDARVTGQHIPPRPFLGPAGFRNAEKVVKLIGDRYMDVWLGSGLLRLGHDSE